MLTNLRMLPTTHFLPVDIIDRLKAEQQRTGATVSEIIRRAVAEYLDRVQQ